jgi:hypothetical protein
MQLEELARKLFLPSLGFRHLTSTRSHESRGAAVPLQVAVVALPLSPLLPRLQPK